MLKIIRVVTDPYAVKYHMPNTLSRIGLDFNVLVVGQDVTQFADQYPNIKFINLKIARKISLMSDILVVVSLIKIILKFKPDIIHSLMPKASLVAALAGFLCAVPVRLHTFTGQVWATKSGLSKFLLRSVDWIVNCLNTVCLTDSISQSHYLYDNGIRSKGKPLPVLIKGSLSGVDVSRFDCQSLIVDSNSLKSKLNINANDFVFIYIARKTVDKGAVDMLKAFHHTYKKYNHSKLLFVGPDEDDVIKKLKLKNPELLNGVIEIGSVNNHEVYLCISNVLCLPSHREGFGSIVIDAAATGIPTIGTKIPGLVDSVIDNQTGSLIELGDVTAFTDSMISYIEQPSKVELFGNNAKERVDKYFAADLHYAALKSFYLKLANEAYIN